MFPLMKRRRNAALFRLTPSQQPSGSTFTRSTTATYVDQSGIVQTAAINALRSGHYIGGVQTILLEGQSQNACLWSNDLTNAAWTKRGTCAVAKTATGPDGVVNSASAITGLGAAGNDVFQVINGLVTGTRGEPHVWIQRVSTSGTISFQNANSAANGNWTIDLALLGAGWVKVTRSHLAVTIVAEFTTGATTSAGNYFLAPGGGPLALNVWGVTYEPGFTFSTSTIPTTTVAVTRGVDSLSFPYTAAPQAMTLFVKYVDLGTSLTTAARLIYVGNAGGGGQTVSGYNAGVFGTLRTDHAGTSDTGTSAILVNDVVESRHLINADGSVQTGFVRNGGTESVDSASAGSAFVSAFSAPTVWIGSIGGATGIGFAAFQSVKIAPGVRSLAEMRNL